MLPELPVITPDTWIIADTHLFHENIGRYCSRPENWQALIIQNWNSLVSPGETVLHLGDFALGKKIHFELLIGELNGQIFFTARQSRPVEQELLRISRGEVV